MALDPSELKSLGAPDLEIAGLTLWIHGRQFPDASDYWDGNWLRVTAYATSPDSRVRTHGSVLHLSEVVQLMRGCEQLYETLEGRAGLDCMEPNLGVELTARGGGHIGVRVSITPDHLGESHEFLGEIDQTYIPGVIAACRRILERLPVREFEKAPA